MHHDHADRCGSRESRPDQSLFPAHLRTDETVHKVQPPANHRATNVCPVNDVAGDRTFQIDQPFNPHQQKARNKHQNADCEQSVSNHHRAADLAIFGVPHMDQTEHNERQHDQQADNDVDQKHPCVELIFVRPFRPPLQASDACEVGTVSSDHGQQSQHNVEHNSQFWPDRFSHDLLWRIGDGRAGCNVRHGNDHFLNERSRPE